MAEQVPTVTVTIGRSVGATGDYLTRERWTRFVEAVRGTVRAVTWETWADSPYVGSWAGRTEDAWLFHGQLAAGADVGHLRAQLAILAAQYGQDGIGLALGRGELVSVDSEPTSADPALAQHLADTAV